MSNTFIKYNPKSKSWARCNRKKPTKAEAILWYKFLRARPLGFKFTRQKPLNNFIADFYCSKLLLVVEVDGNSHIGRENYDKFRTSELEKLGIKVIRYQNNDVLHNFQSLCSKILYEFNFRIKQLKCSISQ